MSPDAVLRIENVHILPRDENRLRGGAIDMSKKGSEFDRYSMSLTGWALGLDSEAVAVEYIHAGTRLGSVPIDLDRPDIVEAFPDAPGALRSGFRSSFNFLPLPPRADLLIQVVLANNERVPLAMITVERKPVDSGYSPVLQPLLVTTLGRTGSTWLVRLLSEHPRITAYRPFEFEPRMLRYWLALLKAGSDPANYMRPLIGDVGDVSWWHDPEGAGSPAVPPLPDPEIERWFGRINVAETAAFAGRRIDAFYQEVARTQKKEAPEYFVEKNLPEFFLPQMTRELFPETKDVILVRDFRDWVSSILRFNRKRGYATFGRQDVATDREFIGHVRGHAVRLLEYWREHPEAPLVRYEDLILRPKPTLEATLGAIGLDSSETVLQLMLDQAATVSQVAQEGHRTSASSVASVGFWRDDLDASLQAACGEAFDDVLEQFGYTP